MEKLKILSCGDIHGRTYWKKIDPSKYDLIVFVGDYLDSFYCSDTEILTNFMDIIKFKMDYMDKVILLLGNHDIQYYFLNEGYGCTGFRPTMVASLKHIFNDNKNLFQVAHQVNNTIWTHAGISQVWYEYNKKEIEEVRDKFNTINLADTFNKMLMMNRNYNSLLHQIGKKRGGRYPSGGITWADRTETIYDNLKNYHQIVGHTPIDKIMKFDDENESITYIDVLSENKTEQNFYECEI